VSTAAIARIQIMDGCFLPRVPAAQSVGSGAKSRQRPARRTMPRH